MPDLRPIVFLNGLVLMVLAVAMAIPAAADLWTDDLDWQVFAASAFVTMFVGAAFTLAAWPREFAELTNRQAFLFTGTVWISAAAFAALPFAFSDLNLRYIDAYFESISGLTTTGSTIIAGLDSKPRGILVWRSLLQWLGGIGIVVLVLAFFPRLRIGGMQLFRTESSERSEKAFPRIRQIARALFWIYLLLTSAAALTYWLLGMTSFEAILHAMTTIATGGFSTSDASLAHWDSMPLQWSVTFFMLLGGASFIPFLTHRKDDSRAVFGIVQLFAYLIVAAAVSLCLGAWLWIDLKVEWSKALTVASFNVVSVMTTTGFASADYSVWGGAAQVLFFALLFVGGCTGSTAGGIKMFRWLVLFAASRAQLRQLILPHAVFPTSVAGRHLADPVVRSVLGFMALYLITFALLAIALAATGLDIVTALSGAAQALGNVGPGLGGVIGPSGNFATLPDTAKGILCVGMVLGRLELMTILVFFLPSFWK